MKTWYSDLKPIVGHLKINGKPAQGATRIELAQALSSVHAENRNLQAQIKLMKEDMESSKSAYVELLKDFNKHNDNYENS